MGSPLPLTSLRLLVPPLRLMSAFMWQVVKQQKLEHFNKLEEYILLLIKMFPEILSDRQKTALVMGLRAKMMLEMCKDEVPVDLETIKARLHTIESKASGSEVENLQCKLLKLILSLLEDPVKKEHFFQEVFPFEYGPDFDKALQVLVGHFLSRLEQLLPVPNFKQAASWLSTETTVWENVVENNWDPRYLLPLLRSDYQGTLETNGLPSVVEDRVISTLSLPPLTDVVTDCESNAENQSEHSVCLKWSVEINQNGSSVNQEVSQESVTDVPAVEIFTSVEVEDYIVTEMIAESEAPTGSLQEEVHLMEKNIEESLVCEVEEEATDIAQSENENRASADNAAPAEIDPDVHEPDEHEPDEHEPDEHESDVHESDVHEPEPSSVISGCNSDLKNVSEEAAEKDPQTNSGHLLKVVVPSRLIPIIKQVRLPSVSLSRCTSDPGPLKMGSAVLKKSASSSKKRGKTKAKIQKKRPHACSECGMSFRCRVELKAHMRRHTEKGPYKCQPCKLNFRTYFQASVHQRKWHSQVTYSCSQCDKSFQSMKTWLMHRKEHRDRTTHRCTDCGKECISLQALINHSKVHNHLVSERLPDAYKCIACGETFSLKEEFVSHMRTHKPRAPIVDRDKAVKRAKRQPGECRFCGQTFSVIELRNHLKSHPEFRPHQCDHCGKCFATLQSLLAHISNHTGEKPHECEDCGKKFFSSTQLKSHMKCHSTERPYCCSYCGKCFLSIGNLTIHTRRHTGEKPYVCLECGKAFSSAGCLQVHRRCHTGEKPYPCNICGRSFIVSSHRVVHMRSHMGVRPYSCEICGKAFTRKRCLSEHVFSHSDVKPFPCSICSKSFTRRGHLKRHMQSHSGDPSSEIS
ncbi:zinc finger protein 879 [Astyanax mexicanus]|uniref:zinc finger protein 879 n=1 Tax=Astyanax mexicanus TaxID=7994 RepID=UPI0020CAE80A|nr:zinc finger protein 879 [Astyanax mexicanus]